MEALAVPEACTMCRKQTICPVCKAAVYQETGTHTKTPQYLCAYCHQMEEICKKEGSGIEGTVQDSGDFHFRGCSD